MFDFPFQSLLECIQSQGKVVTAVDDLWVWISFI